MVGTWLGATLPISLIPCYSYEFLIVWPTFEVPASYHVVLMRPGGTARSTHIQLLRRGKSGIISDRRHDAYFKLILGFTGF